MSFSFVPKKLIEVKRDIVKKHSHKINIVLDIRPDEDFEKLIKKIVSLDDSQLKREAYSLSDAELNSIASYVSANFYKVNLRKLFFILKLRTSYEVAISIFYSWQNNYDNKECNMLLIDFLHYDNYLGNLLIKNNLTKEKFIKFLKSDSILLEFYIEINENKLGDFSMNEMLKYFGIRENSRFFLDFEKIFYMHCNKKHYLKNGKKLINIVKQYSLEELYKFLENFLRQFNLEELCKNFSNLLDILEDKRKKRHIKYHFIFEDKYNNWVNIDTIYKFFINDINDERFMFWKDYNFFEKPVKYDKSNSLTMKFQNHVVVEFLGRANGPLYIFNKYFFEDNIKRYLPNKSNSELRKILLRIYKLNSHNYNIIREEHQANWRFKVQGVINQHNIAELITE